MYSPFKLRKELLQSDYLSVSNVHTENRRQLFQIRQVNGQRLFIQYDSPRKKTEQKNLEMLEILDFFYLSIDSLKRYQSIQYQKCGAEHHTRSQNVIFFCCANALQNADRLLRDPNAQKRYLHHISVSNNAARHCRAFCGAARLTSIYNF